MIADNIQRIKRADEFHDSNYFVLNFKDGSFVTEKEINWSSVAEERVVTFMGIKKTVGLCTLPVASLSIVYGDLKTTIDVPEGCEVYQAFKSQAVYTPKGEPSASVIGRTVGLVMGDEVIEERYLDGMRQEVVGVEV